MQTIGMIEASTKLTQLCEKVFLTKKTDRAHQERAAICAH
jgi:hypothetical protein